MCLLADLKRITTGVGRASCVALEVFLMDLRQRFAPRCQKSTGLAPLRWFFRERGLFGIHLEFIAI
jgi:hypothetical protein